jgi:hypothetical protein
MQDDIQNNVLKFCDTELEHLRLEQEFVLHELTEYRNEKLKEVKT